MTNEIKEKIEYLKKVAGIYEGARITEIEDYITNLQEENKQLKEELENDIDRYEDAISYQFGFDKGKEYMQQRIDKANQLIEKTKKKMYKSRNKIAMYILINLENILRGDE